MPLKAMNIIYVIALIILKKKNPNEQLKYE